MPPAARIPSTALMDAIKGGKYPFWFPSAAKDLAMDYFVYGCEFTPLGAGASDSRNIQINSDSAFLILSATLVETDTANTTFFPNRPLTVQLSTGGAGLNLANIAIAADNWFGTAEEPKYWDVPKTLLPNTVFQVSANNLEATARNLRFAFHGFKIFKFKKD